MPPYFFTGMKDADYSTAVPADTSRQTPTICFRHWYLDVWFECIDCEERFLFSAAEQRAWYEEYQLRVDAIPVRCSPCRPKHKQAANAVNSRQMLLYRSPDTPKRASRLAELEAEIRGIYGFWPASLRP